MKDYRFREIYLENISYIYVHDGDSKRTDSDIANITNLEYEWMYGG